VIPGILEGSTDTQEVIQSACTKTGQVLGDWPGANFEMGDEKTGEAFFALLGSAHGLGTGFMLTQHKAWFGNKKVDKITVWLSPGLFGGGKPNMALRIVEGLEDSSS